MVKDLGEKQGVKWYFLMNTDIQSAEERSQ